jgi:hypothetical protein
MQRFQRGLQYGRANADFPESFRNAPSRPERISDHDPLVAYFAFPVDTTTTLAADSNPSVFGQPVTFTVTVAAVPTGAGAPTGTVQFFDGGTPLGGATLDGRGQASLVISDLSIGSHTIAAEYGGSSSFKPSTGSVDQAVEPGLSISDVTIEEGNGRTTSAIFNVSLSSAERNKHITVVVNGDTSREPSETFFVNLSDAVNATIADGRGRGTIHNDDPRRPRAR